MKNSLSGTGMHSITLNEAMIMTSRFRNHLSELLSQNYQHALCKAETFSLPDVHALLSVKDAAALRIYYGMKEDNTVHAILVAVNSNGEDILPVNEGDETVALILEDGLRCPKNCPENSPLNADT